MEDAMEDLTGMLLRLNESIEELIRVLRSLGV